VLDERLTGRLADMDATLDAADQDPATLRRTVGVEIVDPDQPTAPEEEDPTFRGSVEELAETFDQDRQLGIDDVIALVLPMTKRSLDRVVQAVQLTKR